VSIQYEVVIGDALGNTLLVPANFSSGDYVRVENDIGALTLVLPGDYDGANFKKDSVISVWRSIDGATPYLDTDTVWLLRRKRWQQQTRGAAFWTLYAYDLNHLLKRRIVDYNPDNTTYTALVEAADDMGKIIMRQNFGSSATDTTRSIATYLDIQADATLAPVVNKAFSRQYVNQVLKDLALASYQKGTYLVFDIVCTVPPGGGNLTFEFQSFTGQRGIDHSFPNGNPPLLIGPQYNNLDNVDLDDDSSDEVTRGIATGQGYGSIQAVARADDLSRQGESPFNLIEGVRNASGTDNATGLTDEAEAELQSGIPRKMLNGNIVNTSGLLYGLDWQWGDLVTAQANGESFECHIPRVHVHVERDSGEVIEGVLRGSVVTE
jgi:hypothetical protein